MIDDLEVKGELIKIEPPEHDKSIVFFSQGGIEVGCLFIDDEGRLDFYGDLSESADILFNTVCDNFNDE